MLEHLHQEKTTLTKPFDGHLIIHFANDRPFPLSATYDYLFLGSLGSIPNCLSTSSGSILNFLRTLVSKIETI